MDQLASRIIEMGYIPDTDFILHDVEEEQKEQFLFQHSEKIAVAYGIISTTPLKPIRIFKNLRVCGNCHTVMKYISRITGDNRILTMKSSGYKFCVQGRAIALSPVSAFELNI